MIQRVVPLYYRRGWKMYTRPRIKKTEKYVQWIQCLIRGPHDHIIWRFLKNTCTLYSVKHFNDVIMTAMASQITSLAIVYSSVYSGADQRKHQSSGSLAFKRGIHRGPVNSPHKWPVARKTFHSMTSSWHAHGFALLGCFCYITSSRRIVIIYPGTFLLTQAYWHNGCPGACEVTLTDIGKTLQVPNPNHSLDLELVKFSRYHRNGKVVRVTALVVNGVVEACLQRLLWRPGQSSWRPSRFNV